MECEDAWLTMYCKGGSEEGEESRQGIKWKRMIHSNGESEEEVGGRKNGEGESEEEEERVDEEKSVTTSTVSIFIRHTYDMVETIATKYFNFRFF
jgi:hypothetical protein